MKKNLLNYSFVLGLGALIGLSSCSDDERPLPSATAEFVVATIAPEAHLPVFFENNSLNAAYYVWDFGDGSDLDSMESVSVSHVYEEGGNYTVKLRAYNEDGIFTELERNVDIGERFLTGLSLVSIGNRDIEGNKIDTSGIEARLFFALDSEPFDPETLIQTDTFNIGGDNPLPGFNIPFDYVLGNNNYFLELVMVTDEEPVLLSGFTFNPLNPNFTFKDEDGLGGYILPLLVEDGYQFFIEFEIK